MSDPKIPNMTAKEAEIMRVLAGSGGEMFGLQMVRESGGKLKRGAIYVYLTRMEEKGFVQSREEVGDDALPRRYYRPTGLGRRVFAAREQVAGYMLGLGEGATTCA